MKKLVVKNGGFIVAAIYAVVFLLSGRMFTASGVNSNSFSTIEDKPKTSDPIHPAQQYKVGDRLDIPELNLKPNSYVDDIAYADVTGDGVGDTIILAGVKEDSGIYSLEHTILVMDGKIKEYSSVSAGESGGYQGRLFTGDFNGDKVPDTMVSAASGGSGGTYFYSVVSFLNNKPNVLAPQDVLSRGAAFEGGFRDNFKAEINNKELGTSAKIDISSGKKDYIENMIYDSSGKLLTETQINVDGFQKLDPVDTDGDGVYELRGVQAIWGFTHPDTIAISNTLWKYEDGRFRLLSYELEPVIK
jgi:hypothetical protein